MPLTERRVCRRVETRHTLSMQERVTRDDVDGRWSRAIAGGAARREAAAWAQEKLDNNPDCEELVLQGLLHLQALIHQPAARGEDVGAALTTWRRELHDYDRDPAAWTSNYSVTMLHSFVERHGAKPTHDFAAKLYADGLITDVDLLPFTVQRG